MERRGSGDSIVFGQLELGRAADADALGGRLLAALEFEQHSPEELLRLDVLGGGRHVRVRAWLLGPSLQSWWPRLHALALAAAKLGASGEVWFVGAQRAYRLLVTGGALTMSPMPPPEADHPALLDVALLVEERAAVVAEMLPAAAAPPPLSVLP